MNPDEMRSRLLRLLGPDGLEAASVDLDALASEGGELPDWLRNLVTAADALPLPEVPAIVTQDLQHMFDEQALVEPHTAVLIRDTRVDKQLVGARGADVADGWSMTYTSAVADLVLDVWPQPGAAVDLAGHVMGHRQVESAFRVRLDGPTELSVDTDGLGRFRAEGLAEGRYTIAISNRLIELTLAAELSKG